MNYWDCELQTLFSPNAELGLEKLKKSGDKGALKKLSQLLNELRENPYTGTGQIEILKHEFSGLFARRISLKHRLVYSVKDDIVTVIIISIYGHYGDK